MLVVASDMHLTDGTTGKCMPSGAYELFRNRLVDMAIEASKRDDSTYLPIESFDLALLGDIFDPLRSTQWTEEEKGHPGYARPWSNPSSPAFGHKLEKITDTILEKNEASLGILRSIAAGEGISIPPATKDHQIDRRISQDPRSRNRLPVKVRIHYIAGNHDWYYHLPGEAFDKIRQKIIAAMGLSNGAGPFPYKLADSAPIEQVFREHQVYGRHGDFYDPFNYVAEKGRTCASLGDALCVELFNRIGDRIKTVLPVESHPDLDEMGSIRPEIMTPVWIAALLERCGATPQQWDQVDEIWHGLVEQFLKLDYLDELNKPFEFDLVDKIKLALRFANPLSLEKLNDWALTVEKLLELVRVISKGNDAYEDWAIKEEAYQSQAARFIVYGHTHNFTVRPLRSTRKLGKPFDQLYLNSGTWHSQHEICRADPHQKGFICHKTMSYLAFYKADERKCRSYETWSGTLDI